MGVCRNVANRTAADKQIPKPVPTDAEVEQAIKARFAQSRKILDVREKYYNCLLYTSTDTAHLNEKGHERFLKVAESFILQY